MAVGYQQVFDVILVFNASGRLAATTATLRLIGMQRLALGITTVGDGDDALFLGNQVADGQVHT